MRRSRAARRAVAGVTLTVLLSGASLVVPMSAAVAAATCSGSVPSDFNGDGISDVAIGEPDAMGAGAVHVLYGSRSGLHADATSSTPNDLLIVSGATPDAAFGEDLVTLDLNGDHCADLVVAAPDATLNSGSPDEKINAGLVAVYFGSPHGLIGSDPVFLTAATPTASAHFGQALAAGHFDGNSFADLVVGEPNVAPDGAVHIFTGSASGVQPTDHRFVPGAGGVPAGDGAGDEFGSAVATGDFNGDGNDDLAVGAIDFRDASGAVMVMNGSGTTTLLSATGAKLWSQDTTAGSAGIAGTAEAGDIFGASLAAGDFNGDHHADLAIGVPSEALGSVRDTGMVNVIYSGGSGGLAVTGNQGWTRNSAGVAGTAADFDEFGSPLVAGDFNGHIGLAIGAAGGDGPSGGSVTVLMGASHGLTSSGSQLWSQGSPGIAGTPESGDGFGDALAVGRIHSSSRDDLIVGAHDESIGSVTEAGEIQVIPGSSAGLTGTGSQTFSAATAGVQGPISAVGLFGTAVS